MGLMAFSTRRRCEAITNLTFLPSFQTYTLWKSVIQTECSRCFAPNDLHYLFCQQCGTPRQQDTPPNKDNQRSVIDPCPLAARWEALENNLATSRYRRKRSALEIEFTSSLEGQLRQNPSTACLQETLSFDLEGQGLKN